MTDNFWQGEHIRLRSLEPSDAQVFFEWNRDSEMARLVNQVLWLPASLESVRRWAEKVSAENPEGDTFFLAMEDGEGEVVGSIGTHHCDRRTGTFSYGVAVRQEHRSKGYASEAISLVLRYFFEELRYQKVTVHIHSDNVSSARLHERLGFQLEGRQRRMIFTQGEYLDDLIYGMTAEEFHASHS